MTTYNAQVCVIAGGPSGLAAAVQAAENGADVIVLEKAAAVGGAANMGIRINENCEVCDREFKPIHGLYAAGADSCNIYDDSYMFLLPGNSMGYAVNTGRIAGMTAAAQVKADAE